MTDIYNSLVIYIFILLSIVLNDVVLNSLSSLLILVHHIRNDNNVTHGIRVSHGHSSWPGPLTHGFWDDTRVDDSHSGLQPIVLSGLTLHVWREMIAASKAGHEKINTYMRAFLSLTDSVKSLILCSRLHMWSHALARIPPLDCNQSNVSHDFPEDTDLSRLRVIVITVRHQFRELHDPIVNLVPPSSLDLIVSSPSLVVSGVGSCRRGSHTQVSGTESRWRRRGRLPSNGFWRNGWTWGHHDKEWPFRSGTWRGSMKWWSSSQEGLTRCQSHNIWMGRVWMVKRMMTGWIRWPICLGRWWVLCSWWRRHVMDRKQSIGNGSILSLRKLIVSAISGCNMTRRSTMNQMPTCHWKTR